MTARTFLLLVAATLGIAVAGAEAEAEELARTATLPAVLSGVDLPVEQVVTEGEAGAIRGESLSLSPILDDFPALRQRVSEVEAAATIVELPGGLLSHGGHIFGEGVFIDTIEGKGAFFDASINTAIFFKNLIGDYTVRRTDVSIELVW